MQVVGVPMWTRDDQRHYIGNFMRSEDAELVRIIVPLNNAQAVFRSSVSRRLKNTFDHQDSSTRSDRADRGGMRDADRIGTSIGCYCRVSHGDWTRDTGRSVRELIGSQASVSLAEKRSERAVD